MWLQYYEKMRLEGEVSCKDLNLICHFNIKDRLRIIGVVI